MKKENLLPMNLQFFAEKSDQQESTEEVKTETVTETTEASQEEVESTPDTKALNEQLQSALVEIARLKRQVDKSSSEAAEFKKKYRESLSETEKASQEKAEAEAKKQEEFESMKKALKINELTENFMDLGYSKDMAKRAATAQAENDTSALLDIQKQFQEKQKKDWEAEFLKSRPEINAGAGTTQTISKETFDKMTLVERTKLKRENKEEYDRLIAL